MKKKIVVFIPCLNEEATIGRVISQFKKKIPNSSIFVYDNNSDDKSIEVAQKCGAKIVKVKKRGKGNVVRKMFSDPIKGDFFVMIDGDDTYDIKNLNEMIQKMEKNNLDMIVARRNHIQSSAYRLGHVFGNRFFSKFVKVFFGNDINDLFSGFRIFSKRFIKTFPIDSKEFEVEAELTIHALEQRLPVAEFECDYKSRPKGSNSKLNTVKDGVKILKLILILIKDGRPLMFFSIFSFLFFISSLYIGFPIIYDFYKTGLVERLPSAVLSGFMMILAFLSFFSGLILDAIKKMRFENKRINYLLFKD